MIKQRAPKDTAISELLELIDSGRTAGLGSLVSRWAETLRIISRIPAPNPFTDNQIAWFGVMRECGMEYAAMDVFNFVTVYEKKPVKQGASWLFNDGGVLVMPKSSFLNKVLTSDDPEPLCFADYAPLEEKDSGD